MAETDDTEKTEDPSQRRLEEALKRGDVAKSQEVNTWFVIGGGTLVLLSFSGSMSADLNTMMRGILANAHALPADGPGLMRLFWRIDAEVLAAVAIPFLIFMIAAIGGNLVQHRLIWSGEALKPKLSKISLAGGAQRLFSKQAIANFVKGLLKLALVGTVLVMLLWPERFRLEGMVSIDPGAILPVSKSLSLELMGSVVAILAVIAAADYLFQYRQWFERQKMSLHELKQEFKQTEGDPLIKGKIRQIRQARMKRRMMTAVKQASVVITNPTHFAVALQYERGMNAPLCLAKGVDALARKIRAVAEEHGIPIVENPPLARALHGTVEIDREIPPEHYQAVAEVISYVMRLNRAVARRN
jgi:flagellar biosynthesis protein FlhB